MISDVEAEQIQIAVGEGPSFDELTGSPPIVVNLLTEKSNSVVARPGVSTFQDFPETVEDKKQVVSIFRFADKLVFVTDDGAGLRRIYLLASHQHVVNLSGGGTGYQIDGLLRPTVVSGHNMTIICGGLAPQLLTSGFVSGRLGGSPPNAIDATIIAQRLVLLPPDSDQFYWSDVGEVGFETWDLSFNVGTAEARPDLSVAIESTTRELWIFGEKTTQVFAPDPNEVFVPGPTLEVGCSARLGTIRFDAAMAWLDDRRRFILSDGRQIASVLSDRSIGKNLELFHRVDDCYGFRMRLGNHDLLLWSFPSIGRTFACDLSQENRWAEWRGWKDGRWVPLAITSYFWDQATGNHMVGLDDGRLGVLSYQAHDDLGETLRCKLRTGMISAQGRRQCVESRLMLRRGQAKSSSSTVDVSWRDDLGDFGQPIRVPLGVFGEKNPTATISPAGQPFRQRQWDVEWSADDAYMIADMIGFYRKCEI